MLKKALPNGTGPNEIIPCRARSSWSCSPFSAALPSPLRCPASVPSRMPLLCTMVFPFGWFLWGTRGNMPFPFCTITGLKTTCFPNEISLCRNNYLAWEVKAIISHFLIPVARWFPPIQRAEAFIMVHVKQLRSSSMFVPLVPCAGPTQHTSCWKLVSLESMAPHCGLHSVCP